jgi:hypothetical protein
VTPKSFRTTLRRSCVLCPLSLSFHSNPVFRSQILLIHTVAKPAPANSFESHTSKKSHINIKTNGFKPHRDTYLPDPFSQLLCNHILLKTGMGGGGYPANQQTHFHRSPVSVPGHDRRVRVPTPVGTGDSGCFRLSTVDSRLHQLC